MLFIRSFIFTVAFVFLTAFVCISAVVLFPFPRKYLISYITWWSRSCLWLSRVLVGIKLVVKGKENLPKEGGYIIACKHQSAFDTVIFHSLVNAPAYIFKIEMAKVPFMGWTMKKMGCIAVDRKGGTRAMRNMFENAKQKLAEGKTVVIFPEGTRRAPEDEPLYNPGVAMIYDHTKAEVVPAAINSGYLWPKNSFLKRAGTVTLEFLPPIKPGMEKRAFLDKLQQDIEGACSRLPKGEKNGK